MSGKQRRKSVEETAPQLGVGTSGWDYDAWRGAFYPSDMNSDELLAFYAQTFSTVEVNYSFYHLPERDIFVRWRERTPSDFLFTVKANRYLTHMKKLHDAAEPLGRFLDAAEGLEEKLDVVLFQLPPFWHADEGRLRGFLELLPERRTRYTFEFRHESWYTEGILNALCEKGVALCLHDHADGPSPQEVTADFVYLRFHGPQGEYRQGYGEEALVEWVERIRDWRERSLDVYAYFNNTARGHAIEDARQLKARLE
ncbi:MAG: DUF72 domain-containing protein [Anaerolineales bacterium]